MTEWRLIETYTNDDGLVLLHEDGALRVAFRENGKWVQPAIPIMLNEYGDALVSREVAIHYPGRSLSLSDCLYEPTHWMPLPETPKE